MYLYKDKNINTLEFCFLAVRERVFVFHQNKKTEKDV